MHTIINSNVNVGCSLMTQENLDAPLTPTGGQTMFFVKKTNVIFEFSTLKLVYIQIFIPIGQADQYDPQEGGCRPFFEKTNVIFEFSTLKLVYMLIFSQIGQVDQYDPLRGASPL